LESGLKLNLNSLARRGIIKPGVITGPVGIAWTNGETGQQIASAYITASGMAIIATVPEPRQLSSFGALSNRCADDPLAKNSSYSAGCF